MDAAGDRVYRSCACAGYRTRRGAAALRVPWEIAAPRGQACTQARARARTFVDRYWLALLCVAAARPQELGRAIAPPQVGRDMMLAVDLSASMGEEDMQLGGRIVDRLTAAKAVLADFLDRRVGDRVGLVVFGDRAYALTPLTLDRDSVRDQLGASVIGLAGRATAIGDAIALATKRLQGERKANGSTAHRLREHRRHAGPDAGGEVARDNASLHAIASWRRCGVSVFGFQLPMGGDEIDELACSAWLAHRRPFFPRPRCRRTCRHLCRDRPPGAVQRQGRAVRPRIERYPVPLAAALGLGLLALVLRRRA